MGKYDVGTVHKNNQGELFEIIERIDTNIRKIKFLTNDYERFVNVSNIASGKAKLNNKYLIGNTFKTNEGYYVKIINKVKDGYYRIKFLDEYGFENDVKYSNLSKGNIKNPFHKSVCGIGYLGRPRSKNQDKENLRIYSIWIAMIKRCYSDKARILSPTYENCTVCEEWMCYDNFEKWYKENYPYSINNITFHIDKDLTQMDNINKIYSPKTVTFIPAKINNFILIYKNNFLDVGNSFDKENNKWVSRIKDFKTNKYLNLGRFSTPEEASQAYKIARAENAEKAKQYLRDLNYLPEEIIQLIK